MNSNISNGNESGASTTTNNNSNNNNNNKNNIEALTSSPWHSDDTADQCTSCSIPFVINRNLNNNNNNNNKKNIVTTIVDNLSRKRRHHCRLCGMIFCHKCSDQRCLVPPSAIVLVPKGGRKATSKERWGGDDENNNSIIGNGNFTNSNISFEKENDPDRMVTFVTNEETKSVTTSVITYTITKNLVATNNDNNVDNNNNGTVSNDGMSYDNTTTNNEGGEMNMSMQDDDLSMSISSFDPSNILLNSTAFVDPSLSQPIQSQSQPQSKTDDKPPPHSIVTTSPIVTPTSTSIPTPIPLLNPSQQSQPQYEHQQQRLLYGRGLEERIKLAREPLRVCHLCHSLLQPIQEGLRRCNSNAMRYNTLYLDNPHHNIVRKVLGNSPLAFTLGHEVRKAAYALGNLLPKPKRAAANVGAIIDVDYHHDIDYFAEFGNGTKGLGYDYDGDDDDYNNMNTLNMNMHSYNHHNQGSSNYNNNNTNLLHNTLRNIRNNHPQKCINATQNCTSTIGNNLNNIGDGLGVRIPSNLLNMAKGIAILTVVKGGLGLAGFEFGTGLIVSRLRGGENDDNEEESFGGNGGSGSGKGGNWRWSAPSAIGTVGVAWGALLGVQITDHVLLLMTDDAVDVMSPDGQGVRIGAGLGIAVGPLGRSAGLDVAATTTTSQSQQQQQQPTTSFSSTSTSTSFDQPSLLSNTNNEQRTPGTKIAPIYSYSLSRGLYAGASLEGKVVVTRHRVNERFYGGKVSPSQLLKGGMPTPPAAQPLYDALRRCRAYANHGCGGSGSGGGGGNSCSGDKGSGCGGG